MNMKINKDMQMAMEYAVYMMIGDEFDKTFCISKWQEMSMLVNYKEIRFKYQYMVEDICLRSVNRLKEELPTDLWMEEAKVQFVYSYGCEPEVRFITNHYMLRVFCSFTGKSTKIETKLLKKEVIFIL